MPLRDSIGGAPAEVKISVTTPYHRAITIHRQRRARRKGWVREDRYGTYELALWPSAALRALLDVLRDLANATTTTTATRPPTTSTHGSS